MLRAGWQLRDYREMFGQAPRIIAAVLLGFGEQWNSKRT